MLPHACGFISKTTGINEGPRWNMGPAGFHAGTASHTGLRWYTGVLTVGRLENNGPKRPMTTVVSITAVHRGAVRAILESWTN